MSSPEKPTPPTFKPRARLLLLLGDQLIKDAGIAVFELVKNAYDADATHVTITMDNVSNRNNGKITITDNGDGMKDTTITNVWLEPGTDYREKQRKSRTRSRLGRLPLGEKGVGRFAAHKLGDIVKIITRAAKSDEVVVEFNWTTLDQYRYVTDIPVTITTRDPEVFKGSKTGTQIEVRSLREDWTRAMGRDVARAITSISSPVERDLTDFTTELKFTRADEQEWLEGLLTPRDVRRFALFHVRGHIDGSRLRYRYSFTPFREMKSRVRPRTHEVTIPVLQIPEGKKKRPVDLSKHAIGKVRFNLDVFDLDPQTLALGVTDKKGLREFLSTSGGIRVYRENVRVYDYGEPGNDWLDLGGRRVNVPARRISNNLVLGAISLDLESSSDLVEKTNREGFVDSPAFRELRDAVSAMIAHVETERNIDKTRIRTAYTSARAKEPVLADIAELRQIAEEKHWNEVPIFLDRIEKDYIAVRDQLLTSATAGLGLTVVIHEVEKGLKELLRAAQADAGSKRVAQLALHISQLVEGLASLVRRSGSKRENVKELIDLAVFSCQLRLKAHHVPVTVRGDESLRVKCVRKFVVATLVNLIDNSIYWQDAKYGPEAHTEKRLYIGTTNDLSEGPAIVVADNGPGFIDPPEYLVQPFMSRKSEGMGLGLHLADQVMRAQGGKLVFPDSGDVKLPGEYEGAVVALQFAEPK